MSKPTTRYALSVGHLAVAKMLKALYVLGLRADWQTDLQWLRAGASHGLNLDEAQTVALLRITAYNLEARYPDVKRAFRQVCTPEYTLQEMATIEELLGWLRSQPTSTEA